MRLKLQRELKTLLKRDTRAGRHLASRALVLIRGNNLVYVVCILAFNFKYLTLSLSHYSKNITNNT